MLSELHAFMRLSPAILTQIRVVAEAKVVKVDFILMVLVALNSNICMALVDFILNSYKQGQYNHGRGHQLPNTTTMASLAILLSAGVTKCLKYQGLKSGS